METLYIAIKHSNALQASAIQQVFESFIGFVGIEAIASTPHKPDMMRWNERPYKELEKPLFWRCIAGADVVPLEENPEHTKYTPEQYRTFAQQAIIDQQLAKASNIVNIISWYGTEQAENVYQILQPIN